jgi:hypothetical protein
MRLGMTKDVRTTIITICKVFKHICLKVYDSSQHEGLKLAILVALCHLEKAFPPSFFDLMNHLCIHLVKELDICGPVHAR